MSDRRGTMGVDQPFFLTHKSPPWVVFFRRHDDLVEKRLAEVRETGGVIRYLNASEMGDPVSLFREFAHNLSFPGYFGHNWDALVDCLDDLHGDWHRSANVAIVIKNADLLLEVSHFPLLVSVLCQAAERANSCVDLDGDPLDREAIGLHFLFLIRTATLEHIAGILNNIDRAILQYGSYLVAE